MIDLYPDFDELFKFSFKNSTIDNLKCAADQNLTLFEDSIKEAIEKFEKEYNCHCTKITTINDKIAEIEEKQSEIGSESENLNHNLQQDKINLYDEQGHYYVECHWLNEQLKSLAEMQIINAFKNVEINMKAMINIAYPKLNTKDFFKWDLIIQFFKSNSINVSQLEEYKNIVDLKNINNSIKHNGRINDNIKIIEEFKNDDEYNFVNLINFYERIKSDIPTFLNKLASGIENDLFYFDEKRIGQISADLKSRMGKNELKILIEKLNEK